MQCPVCVAASKLEQRCSDADLYRCPVCDHCFSDPASLKDTEDYGPEYYDEVHQNWFDNPNIALFDFIERTIRDHKPDASVLDVGCGRGDLLVHLHSRNNALSLTGLDLGEVQLPEGIRYVQGDVLTVDLPRKFDVVVTMLVIEHLVDVQVFTRRLKELLAPNGILIIVTINDRSILYESSRMLHGLGIKTPYDRLYSRHHVNHFNTTSLKKLAETNSLNISNTLLSNIPMAAVDMPPVSDFKRAIMRAGVWGTFVLGRLTGRTFLQTIVCKCGTPAEDACAN